MGEVRSNGRFVPEFLNHHEIQRHSSSRCNVGHINDVDALDTPAFGVIEIVADHARFFAVRFLHGQIVDTEAGILVLDFSNGGFHVLPVVFAGPFSICEGAGDAVVTEFTIEDVREAGRGGLTEIRDQVVAIKIDHFSVHAGSLGVHAGAVKPSQICWALDGILKLAA
jgi:hypothetical protein